MKMRDADWLDDLGNVARDLFARLLRYVRRLRAGSDKLTGTLGEEETRPSTDPHTNQED